MSKDFTGINAASVAGNIATATSARQQQGTATKEEEAARRAAMKTQGRKGCKAMRLNMAFTPENYSFIRITAGATGQSMTAVVNRIISQCREEHPDVQKAAAAVYASLEIDPPEE